jgi:hypothetical protein
MHYNALLTNLQNLDKWTLLVITCLIYVIIKWIRRPNRPTLEETKELSPEETKEIRKKNHVHRVRTALFYVPFVPIASVVAPPIMICFLILMTLGAINEYIVIVAPLSDEEKRKER